MEPLGAIARPYHLYVIFILAIVRIGGLLVFSPLLSSAAIYGRIKVMLTIVLAVLVTPILERATPSSIDLAMSSILNELSIGFVFGLSLNFIFEAIAFSGMLIGMQFSFSLVNLLDPNTMIETPVLGQMLNWLGMLTLLSAGLHRTLIAGFVHTFDVVPLGSVVFGISASVELLHLASGIFFLGIQLASPVIASALIIEVVISLVSKLSPQLPAMVLSIPIKTSTSYLILIGGLAVWPGWIESHFCQFLRAAENLVAKG